MGQAVFKIIQFFFFVVISGVKLAVRELGGMKSRPTSPITECLIELGACLINVK